MRKTSFHYQFLKVVTSEKIQGLLIEIGEFKGLLTVDSNLLNFGKLPEVDLVCSSFAGGASDFHCVLIMCKKEKGNSF